MINEKLIEKNIITATISSNFTKTSSAYELLVLNDSVSLGDKLTLTNTGKIKIGSGVSYVKVSAKVSFDSVATTALKWLTIFKNTTSTVISANPCNLSARNMIYATSMLVAVQENDELLLEVNGATNDVIRGGIAYTNITVEVVE